MPTKPSANRIPAVASGTHDSASPSRKGRRRKIARPTNSVAAAIGIGSSAMISGRWNQRSKMRVDSSGAAIEMTAIASAVAHSVRSEEHTSELQSLMRISYAVFCLQKKNKIIQTHETKHATTTQQA